MFGFQTWSNGILSPANIRGKLNTISMSHSWGKFSTNKLPESWDPQESGTFSDLPTSSFKYFYKPREVLQLCLSRCSQRSAQLSTDEKSQDTLLAFWNYLKVEFHTKNLKKCHSTFKYLYEPWGVLQPSTGAHTQVDTLCWADKSRYFERNLRVCKGVQKNLRWVKSTYKSWTLVWDRGAWHYFNNSYLEFNIFPISLRGVQFMLVHEQYIDEAWQQCFRSLPIFYISLMLHQYL